MSQITDETKKASERNALLTDKGQEAVFEVVDYTNDEVYYPLGIFPTLETALKFIEAEERKDRPVSPHQDEEFETIVIVKRLFGWTENGVRVQEINRKDYYNEDTDEYLWKRVGS